LEKTREAGAGGKVRAGALVARQRVLRETKKRELGFIRKKGPAQQYLIYGPWWQNLVLTFPLY
jgi:hypothetical protein